MWAWTTATRIVGNLAASKAGKAANDGEILESRRWTRVAGMRTSRAHDVMRNRLGLDVANAETRFSNRFEITPVGVTKEG